jgi:flavin reductase (DIM6/NTAB) family NADH-FMN oxidoreductase RutF
MALRLTSPAVELMKQSRRMALAGAPFSQKDVAYKLGEHHRKARIDWDTLPFATRLSSQFGLPVSKDALRVREVRVEEFHAVGSHMLFLTSVVSDTLGDPPTEKQLFHAFYGTRQPPRHQELLRISKSAARTRTAGASVCDTSRASVPRDIAE